MKPEKLPGGGNKAEREHKEERILKKMQKRIKSINTLSFLNREETRVNKPAGRAETGATSIPMKF